MHIYVSLPSDILAEDEPSKVDDQKSGSSSRSQKLLSEDNRKSVSTLKSTGWFDFYSPIKYKISRQRKMSIIFVKFILE